MAIAVNSSLHTRLNSIIAQYAPYTEIQAPSYSGLKMFCSISTSLLCIQCTYNYEVLCYCIQSKNVM